MIRTYGPPPYTVAVLHGGPGAPGYMAPVARGLQSAVSILEPLQSEKSVQGQLGELRRQILDHGKPPMTLVGSSWGAMLALLFAADHSGFVKKVVLVGSGVFDAKSSEEIEATRLERLSQRRRERYKAILQALEQAPSDEAKKLFRELVCLFFPADTWDPLTTDLELLDVHYEIFKEVWPDFVALRDRPGYLKDKFSNIDIPVVVIHGDHDPHPIDGIRSFLTSCLQDVRFHILPQCGHYPWIERQARDKFFEMLREEVLKP